MGVSAPLQSQQHFTARRIYHVCHLRSNAQHCAANQQQSTWTRTRCPRKQPDRMSRYTAAYIDIYGPDTGCVWITTVRMTRCVFASDSLRDSAIANAIVIDKSVQDARLTTRQDDTDCGTSMCLRAIAASHPSPRHTRTSPARTRFASRYRAAIHDATRQSTTICQRNLDTACQIAPKFTEFSVSECVQDTSHAHFSHPAHTFITSA